MCNGIGPNADTDTPASDLAALMRRHMGCNISAGNLERFLLNHWSKVSFLAHKIHSRPVKAEEFVIDDVGSGP